MLVEFTINLFKSQSKKIFYHYYFFKLLKHRKLDIYAKMSFFSKPVEFRLCSWHKNLKIERNEVPFTPIRQGKYCFGILTYCNWGERCDRLSRGSLRCNSSMIWPPWFSGETPVHSAKVTTWRKSRLQLYFTD